jgi:hypothetical protein
VRWAVVDERDGEARTRNYGAVVAFPIAGAREARFVGMRQTGPNHAGKFHLALSAFELFGTMLDVKRYNEIPSIC